VVPVQIRAPPKQKESLISLVFMGSADPVEGQAGGEQERGRPRRESMRPPSEDRWSNFRPPRKRGRPRLRRTEEKCFRVP
jgi:hypothetical protein